MKGIPLKIIVSVLDSILIYFIKHFPTHPDPHGRSISYLLESFSVHPDHGFRTKTKYRNDPLHAEFSTQDLIHDFHT